MFLFFSEQKVFFLFPETLFFSIIFVRVILRAQACFFFLSLDAKKFFPLQGR